jgi:uncharacterized membrane protein SirB2
MIEYYSEIKFIHVACVVLSFMLFALRGYWAIVESALSQSKWAKVLPHPVDTVLLIAGVTLALSIHQYPLVDAWLTTKVTALFVYLMAAWIALRAKTKQKRIQAFVVAVTLFLYIIWVAITKNAYVMGSIM